MNISDLCRATDRLLRVPLSQPRRRRRQKRVWDPEEELRKRALSYGDHLLAVQSLAPEFCLLYGIAAHELRTGNAVVTWDGGMTPPMRRFHDALNASELRVVIERMARRRAIERRSGGVS